MLFPWSLCYLCLWSLEKGCSKAVAGLILDTTLKGQRQSASLPCPYLLPHILLQDASVLITFFIPYCFLSLFARSEKLREDSWIYVILIFVEHWGGYEHLWIGQISTFRFPCKNFRCSWA